MRGWKKGLDRTAEHDLSSKYQALCPLLRNRPMPNVPVEVLTSMIEVVCCFVVLLMTTAGYVLGLR
jgi:hypothetical protein